MKCVAGNNVAFIEFKYKGENLLLKEIEYYQNGFDSNAQFINSSKDFNFVVSLFKHPLIDNFILRGWKDSIEFQVENIKSSPETELHEISFKNYILLNKQ